MIKVLIWTDGSCSGNPGPGGWGVILQYGKHEKTFFGGEKQTTNNQMELMSVIKALEALTRPCDIVLYTDSQYVRNGITTWIHNWKKNNYKSKSKKQVKNVDLWKKLDELSSIHKIEWIWVKGHSSNAMNIRVDKLARQGTKINKPNFIV